MSQTQKTSQTKKDPDAPGQLLIRRSNRDLDWIRQSAQARGMSYSDHVFDSCLRAENVQTRLVAYLDPAALPILQHLTAELSRQHRELGATRDMLRQILRALPSATEAGAGEAEDALEPMPEGGATDVIPVRAVESMAREALRQSEEMQAWLKQMLRMIWKALR